MDTDLRLAQTSEVRKEFVENPDKFDPRGYLGKARTKVYDTVYHKIKDVFGSKDKA